MSDPSGLELVSRWFEERRAVAFDGGPDQLLAHDEPPIERLSRRHAQLDKFKATTRLLAQVCEHNGIDSGRLLAIILPATICDNVGRASITWDEHDELEVIAEQLKAKLAAESGKPDSSIPAEFRTRVLNKAEAASLHSGQRKENPSDYIKTMVSRGQLTPPIGGGKSWQFDIRQFPESVRDKLR